jgi:type IV pilus assembly protein PilV
MFLSSGNARGQRGISMIEVLVTIVIISFGLLGVAGLLATGLRNNQSSEWRTQASILAYDMAERMRSNRQAGLDGQYATATAASGVPATDKTDWSASLAARLPSGTGTVTMTDVRYFTIVIQWDDTKGAGGGATEQFQFRGEL